MQTADAMYPPTDKTVLNTMSQLKTYWDTTYDINKEDDSNSIPGTLIGRYCSYSSNKKKTFKPACRQCHCAFCEYLDTQRITMEDVTMVEAVKDMHGFCALMHWPMCITETHCTCMRTE